jgi:hypothetical protein
MMNIGLGTKLGVTGGGSYGIGGREASYSNDYHLAVDGTEYVELLSSSETSSVFSDSFSYQIWLYDGSFSTCFPMGIVTSGAPNYEVSLRLLTFGPKYIQVATKFDSSGATGLAGPITWNSSSWNHLVVTVEKGASASDTATVKLYLNGSLIETNTNGPTKSTQEAFSAASGHELAIGARSNTNGTIDGHFSGKMDEFAIWSTALDADAVTAIYNSGSSIDLSEDSGNYDNSSNLQHWYRFENDYTDETGNGTTGTAQGTPDFVDNTNPPGSP